MSGGRLRWGWRLFLASKWFRQHLAVASFPAFVYTASASTSDRQPNYDARDRTEPPRQAARRAVRQQQDPSVGSDACPKHPPVGGWGWCTVEVRLEGLLGGCDPSGQGPDWERSNQILTARDPLTVRCTRPRKEATRSAIPVAGVPRMRQCAP